MNRRLNKLIKELETDPSEVYNVPLVRSENIKKRVNDELNTSPYERKIYMKHKVKRTVLVAAIIALLGASTVFATVNLNAEFLKAFFTGDTSSLAEFVQTPMESVTDGRFTLALDGVLATKDNALVIFSIEALTDETVAILNEEDEDGNSTFWGMDTISFGPAVAQTARLYGFSQREIRERRTDTKRYFTIAAEITNENGADFRIRLNKMAESKDIIIQMDVNVETKELVLGDEAVVQITPLGITMNRRFDSGYGLNVFHGLFFRMSDGEIKTASEIISPYLATSMDEESGKIVIRALLRQIVNLSEFESIMLGDTEFNFNDTSITKPFTPDIYIQPFELVPYFRDHLRVPIEEVCKNVGATFRWGDGANYAVIEYRNSTFVIEVDSTVIVKNGERIDFYNEFANESSFISSDGRLVVSHRLLDLMGINTVVSNMFNEDFSFNEVKNWIWLVIP